MTTPHPEHDTSADTMRAVTATAERTWTRIERQVPSPGPGQVLIRAQFGAINNADVHGMDRAAEIDPTVVLGYECSGTVDSVGPGVDESWIGTRVTACTPAAFAEYVVADLGHVLRVPDDVDLADAVALPTALLTEWGALRAGGFEKGQTVLVTGATSAIGLVAIQLAKALGSERVLAVTRSSDKSSWLREVGADDVVVWADDQQSVADQVRAALGEDDDGGVDLVLDHVAGPMLAEALAASRKHGTVVQVGRLGGSHAEIDVDTLSFGRKTLIGVSFGEPSELTRLLDGVREHVMGHVASGAVRAVVDDVIDWSDTGEAVTRVRESRARGKVVLELSRTA